MAILFLQVALQLTQQLHITDKGKQNYRIKVIFVIGSTPPPQLAVCRYLTLIAELCGVDVQLLKLLLELVEVSLQPGVLQLDLVQLTLEQLVIFCHLLIVVKKLTIGLIQPYQKKEDTLMLRCALMRILHLHASSPVLLITQSAAFSNSGPVLFFLQSHPQLLLFHCFLQVL